jgi:enoyl-CoA hydratase/carnithine racemase
LGLIPGFGGIPRLARDCGNAVVRDLLLTGRSLGAARAHEIGLVSQLAAPGEAPAIAMRVAEQARRFDWRAAAACKSFAKPMPKAQLAREKDIFCELFTSPEVEKALDRFVEDESAMPYLPPSGEDRT